MDIKWIQRFFDLTKEISKWSKDPSTKVGAIIVDDNYRIVSQGYNGFPRGVEDCKCRYNNREVKYKMVVHAELNAILNALYNGASVKGCSIFIHALPVCNECAKAIIQSGIKTVYIDTQISERWSESWRFSMQMFKESKIAVYIYDNGEITEIKE